MLSDIRAFWNEHPCGQGESDPSDLEQFFAAYDAARYRAAPHLLPTLDSIDWSGKRVLEIGLGQGADSEQLIRRGAIWTGLDLTPEAVRRVRARLLMRGLQGTAVEGSITDAPFPDRSFDILFSHGVLHHIPDVQTVSGECARLLKPGGELIVMLYARYSADYFLTLTARRALLLWHVLRDTQQGNWGIQARLARETGIVQYLCTQNMLNRNTDGPKNPHTRVYSAHEIARDFPQFRLTRTYKRYLYPPPLPARFFGLERLFGWHLWAHLKV